MLSGIDKAIRIKAGIGGPAIVAIVALMILTFVMLLWAFALNEHFGGQIARFSTKSAYNADVMVGMSAVFIRSVITVGFIVWISNNVPKTPGLYLIVSVIPVVAVGFMLDPTSLSLFANSLSGLAVGVTSELFLRKGCIGVNDKRIAAFVIPMILWGSYIGFRTALEGRPTWNTHLVFGSIFLGAFTGVFLELAKEHKSIGEQSANLPGVAV